VQNAEPVILLVTVLTRQLEGVPIDLKAGLCDDFGPFTSQELGDHWHEGEGLFLLIGDNE